MRIRREKMVKMRIIRFKRFSYVNICSLEPQCSSLKENSFQENAASHKSTLNRRVMGFRFQNVGNFLVFLLFQDLVISPRLLSALGEKWNVFQLTEE